MPLPLHVLAILIVAAAWLFFSEASLSPLTQLIVAITGILAIIPLVLLGRRELDRQPGIERAHKVTTWVHYPFALLMGSAVIAATRFCQLTQSLPIATPPWIGLALITASSLLLLLILLNLVIKGLGGPLAIALTRRIATEWFYAWTRNPIVLAALVLLAGVAFLLQSGLFLLWVVLIVAPAALLFLVVFEERELEIRFGQDYLDYKARTPRLIPRAPIKR